MRLRTTLILVGALSVLALTGCTPGADDQDETNSPDPETSESATPTESASAEPTTPPEPAASIPTDCASIAPVSILSTVTSGMDLQSTDDEIVRPRPTDATTALYCPWYAAGSDVTGMDVLISSTTPAAAAQAVPGLSAQGYACETALGGTRCTLVTPNSQYPVDYVETVFSRGDVWIYIGASNVDDTGLLDGMVTTIWG